MTKTTRRTAPAKDIKFTGTPREWFALVVEDGLREELLLENSKIVYPTGVNVGVIRSFQAALACGFDWRDSARSFLEWRDFCMYKADNTILFVPHQEYDRPVNDDIHD